MIKIYFILCTCSTFCAYPLVGQNDYDFKLDIPIDSSGLNYYGDFVLSIGPSSQVQAREFKIGAVKFFVGVDKCSHIVFYSTNDSNFLINKRRYLTRDQHFLDSIKSNSKLMNDAGWAGFIPVEDGWNLGFDFEDVKENPNSKGYVLKKGATPTFIFKKSWKACENRSLQGKVRGAQVIN